MYPHSVYLYRIPDPTIALMICYQILPVQGPHQRVFHAPETCKTQVPAVNIRAHFPTSHRTLLLLSPLDPLHPYSFDRPPPHTQGFQASPYPSIPSMYLIIYPPPFPSPKKYNISPSLKPAFSLKCKLLPRNHRRRLLLRRILLPTHRARIRAVRAFIAVFPSRLDLGDAFFAGAFRGVGGVGVFGAGGEEFALWGC